jgi:AraC-like DNA-binding protein
MVCGRCKAIVESDMDTLGIKFMQVDLGEITITKKLSALQHKKLYTILKQSGFELISDKKNDLIEKLKKTIVDLENCSDEELHVNYTDFISLNVKDNYISLNKLFSEIEGITIEKYIIRQKIEKVKELLDRNDLNISEIAVKMHYSSVTQLSSQFKSMTGLTPSHFKQIRHINFNSAAVN